ncbi:MAG: CbiX/SirB N-terminal domain-containing protein [Betaproteobacteria bacterium]|nr:CbiX/SirB N-terminal domain-containing protein [Betaproteobacteria bacterium]
MPQHSALVLFAHGSRDPEWVRPFEALRESVRLQAPDIAIELAYLESTAPDLNLCVRTLAAGGVTAIKVLPLFLALGKHLRTDIPELAARIQLDYPDLRIEFLPALGQAPEFAAALGAIALRVTR